VRVAGDVIEDGVVREFRTAEKFYSYPDVNFEVRFENKGNVHIQPQGEIVIKNMWGKERGIIPINHQTHFGNVLPNSIRKFEFAWKGEYQFSDIGRYSAELALAYGTDNRKFVTSKTYFWVVPVKSVVTVLGTLVVVILFGLWAVKTYIRRMLTLEGYQPVRKNSEGFRRAGDVLVARKSNINAPVRAGWFDLKSRLQKTSAFVDTLKTLLAFIWVYRIFFGAVAVTLVILALGWYFMSTVLTNSRDYEVTIDNPDSNTTLSSEEILFEKQKQEAEAVPPPTEPNAASSTNQTFILNIVNSSDTTGAAAALGQQLSGEYEVNELRSDFGEVKQRSVIVYHPELQAEALALRGKVGDFILSALPPEEVERTITIYIGNDYVAP